MRYVSFRIQNFKGIRDTRVDLGKSGSAGVFCLVGLNESGKTTILEAIHSFSPDEDTSQLVGGDSDSGIPYGARVPRHLISNFNGDVSVAATIELDVEDKKRIHQELSAHSFKIDPSTLPDEVILERHQTFRNGDFQGNYFSIRNNLMVVETKVRGSLEPHLRRR